VAAKTPAGARDWPLAGRGNFGQPSEREVVTDRANGSVVSSVHCMNDPQREGHMASHIGRRKFFATLGGAAAAWPLAASAQQTKIARLGFVSWQAPTRIEDLRQGLRELGYVEGKNIEIEVHFVDGDLERTQNAIRTLVQKGVDILVVRATPAAHIAKTMTQTIPIVMQVSDPLATGLVKSLSHPGGNLTGVANSGPDLAGKRLELLREIKPGLRTVAFLGSSKDPNGATFARETKVAADQIGMNVLVRLLDSADALHESDFQAMQRDGVEAVIVQPIFTGHRVKIVGLARNSRLPVIADYLPCRSWRFVDLRRRRRRTGTANCLLR